MASSETGTSGRVVGAAGTSAGVAGALAAALLAPATAWSETR